MRYKATVVGIIALAIGYQSFIKDLLFVTLGIRRIVQPIEDFPYSCHKVYGSGNLLQGCEDMWLDDEGRTLYAACDDLTSRHEWSPGGDMFNVSGRIPNGRFVALNIDSPGSDGNYGANKLQIAGDYLGPAGSKSIDPLGFDVEVLPNNRLRFWMTNLRPPVDPVSGEYLDATKEGANATIESFELTRGDNTLKWIGTFGANGEVVHSPNNVAADLSGGFVITNDHSARIGLRRSLGLLLEGGSVVRCTHSNECTIVDQGLSFPNGLARGLDGLFYVPSSITGRIGVYNISATVATKIDEIEVGMPIDNLSVDANGDIFAAAVPNALKLFQELMNPAGMILPSTVWQIRKLGIDGDRNTKTEGNRDSTGSYRVWKVLEDREGRWLPTMTTTAVHDDKTGRIFLSSLLSDHITVCEPISVAE